MKNNQKNTEKLDPTTKMRIKADAFAKLKAYVDLVDTEISGLGKIEIDEQKNIIVVDFKIFEQTASAGSTNIDSKAIAKFFYELQQKNESTVPWNLWWHSHAHMEPFWSGTDNKTIEDHAGGGAFLASLVINKKLQAKARLDVFPKDLSVFKKESFVTYDLDIEYEQPPLSKEQQNEKKQFLAIIKKAEKDLKKLKQRYEKIINGARNSILEIENINIDTSLIINIEKEIKEKVKEQTYLLPHRQVCLDFGKKEKWTYWEDDVYYDDPYYNQDYYNKYYSK